MTRDDYITSQINRHWDSLEAYAKENNLEVVGLFLQGSQNYELDEYSEDYKSDVDTKAIVIPSLKNIIDGGSPISTTLVLDNNEHIDVKDIRVWTTMWEKQNIAYLEVLFTKYYILNSKYEKLIHKLRSKADEISVMNKCAALKCMSGMSKEKINALKHPFPSALEKLDKFGYDPKQLHHIVRINEITKRYISGESLKTAYLPNDKNYLMCLKKGSLSNESATSLAEMTDAETMSIVKDFCNNNSVSVDLEAKEFLYDIKRELITTYLRNLFKEENK